MYVMILYTNFNHLTNIGNPKIAMLDIQYYMV